MRKKKMKTNNDFLSGYKTYDPEREGYGNPHQWKRDFFKRMTPDEATRILNEDDPYEILGLKRKSTKSEIKKAYYKMALKWHPDRNPENVEFATKMMQKINAAYYLLTMYY